MDVMENAMRLGENGHARWQMKPLYDATQSGVIAWLRVGYLKELWNQGGRLERRQDVPQQYFLTAKEVTKQALFNVTYKWLSHGHPDPDCFHLARLVDVLTNENADDDDGVFFDFSSLYREPRSEDQRRLFEEGLRAANYVYCNFRVGCIVLSETPEGYLGPSLWQGGWCHVEFLQSTLCQRIVNAKDPSVSEHMIPEWLVGWRGRLHDSMQFVNGAHDRDFVEGLTEKWASQLPAARVDAVGFVVTCAVANFRFVRCDYLRDLAVRGGPSPRRQDLPRGAFVDGHVPAGRQLWVLSYPWSAQTHPSPDGKKVRELVCELDKYGASDDDVVFVDHMSLWQGHEVVPKIYVTQNKVEDFSAQNNGLVGLRDRALSEQKEFKFALFETTRLYAFAGGSLPDGTYLKGCRVLVLPEIDDYKDFPGGGTPCLEMNNFCEPPRRE